MNKKTFLATLLVISIGIIAIYLFAIEQPYKEQIPKENYTQQKNYTSPELSNIKNNSFDIQNSSLNLTQIAPQQQNLSVNNISKNETYETIYKYILKEDNHGKTLEYNITTYVKEEWINGTKYVVAESKLDDLPNGLFSIDFLYDTIEYVNLQTGDIKLVKIPYGKVKNGTLKTDEIKSIPENKSEEEFPHNIIYSGTPVEMIYSDKPVDSILYAYFIKGQISLFHPLYLIGFVKFEPEPENITITERTDLLEIKYSDSPFEGKESQTLPCGVRIHGDKPPTYYYGVRKYNVSYTKNTTKGIIVDTQYPKEEFCSYKTNLPKDEFEEEMQMDEGILKYHIITISINFLGVELFKGKEAYKIESKLKEEGPDDLFEGDTIIWVDKKDKIILGMNSTGKMSGFSAKNTVIYEIINESIVKK